MFCRRDTIVFPIATALSCLAFNAVLAQTSDTEPSTTATSLSPSASSSLPGTGGQLSDYDATATDAAALLAASQLLESLRTPVEYLDPAFEQYVDVRLLRQARREMDPALLTDVALQLAQGEQRLLRSHKLVTADALLKLAFDWATHFGDTTTLRRLRTTAAQLNKPDLLSYIEARTKLDADSRDNAEFPAIAVDSMTPAEFGAVRDLLRIWRDASLLKDHATLAELRDSIESGQLTKAQRDYLRTVMGARPMSPGQHTQQEQETADVLNKLGADGRWAPNGGNGAASIVGGILSAIGAGLQQGQNSGGYTSRGNPSTAAGILQAIGAGLQGGRSPGRYTPTGNIPSGAGGGSTPSAYPPTAPAGAYSPSAQVPTAAAAGSGPDSGATTPNTGRSGGGQPSFGLVGGESRPRDNRRQYYDRINQR